LALIFREAHPGGEKPLGVSIDDALDARTALRANRSSRPSPARPKIRVGAVFSSGVSLGSCSSAKTLPTRMSPGSTNVADLGRWPFLVEITEHPFR